MSPHDLLPLPNTSAMMNRDGISKANFVKSLHEKVKTQIEKRLNNILDMPIRIERRWFSKRVIWFVWIHLRKNRFPSQRKSKLRERGDGHFKVLERINDNTYKIDLPLDYGVSKTFNVTGLTLCDIGTYDISSRANSSQE